MEQRHSKSMRAAQNTSGGPRLDVSAWTLGLVVALIGTAPTAVALRPLAETFQANQGHDFLLLYAAAHALRDHQNPYDAAVFLRHAQAAGVPPLYLLDPAHRLNQPYVYPPLFAWLVIPFTIIKPLAALLVWRIVSAMSVFVGTLAMTALWAGETGTGIFASRTRRVLLAAIVTCAPATLYGLYWGNPVVVVYAAMGLWLWALRHDSARMDALAGALMSAALLKPQLALPLALCAALCLTRGADAWARRRRIAVSFGLACAALLTVDLVVTGPALLGAWPRAVLHLSQMTYTQREMPSLVGLFVGVGRELPGWGQAIVSAAAVLLGAGSIIWAYRGLRERWPQATVLALLTVIWCFATPYAHVNDEILLVPGGLALLAGLPVLLSAVAASVRGSAAAFGWLAQTATTAVGLASLWIGGVLIDIEVRHQALPENVAAAFAPLLLLVALGTQLWPETHGSRSRTVARGTYEIDQAPPPIAADLRE